MTGETDRVIGSAMGATTRLPRVGYLDNIRVFLTGLVVLHHFAITYGAPGWWFYVEQPVDGLTGAVLFPFVAINQAYFMGFFFLLSAYLLPGSLKRKGRKQYSVRSFASPRTSSGSVLPCPEPFGVCDQCTGVRCVLGCFSIGARK